MKTSKKKTGAIKQTPKTNNSSKQPNEPSEKENSDSEHAKASMPLPATDSATVGSSNGGVDRMCDGSEERSSSGTGTGREEHAAQHSTGESDITENIK